MLPILPVVTIGMDASILEELSGFDHFKKTMEGLWENDDIMRQIDADSEMSRVMRNVVDYREVMRAQGYVPSQASR